MPKKKKHTPFLDIYYECMKDNRMLPISYISPVYHDRIRHTGLCSLFIHRKLIEQFTSIFEPTKWDYEWLRWEGHAEGYWGSGSANSKAGEFTDLRQTIVLFMAAENGEL